MTGVGNEAVLVNLNQCPTAHWHTVTELCVPVAREVVLNTVVADTDSNAARILSLAG